MTFPSEVSPPNDYADYWRFSVGVNVIPAISRFKNFYKDLYYTKWFHTPIPLEQHNQWKAEGKFNEGMAVILGKVWHREDKKHLYLFGVDCDNRKAIEEIICTSVNGSHIPLEKAAQFTIIEQHADNPNKAHVYGYTTKPFLKKSSDSNGPLSDKINANEIPAVEVKCSGHGVLFCTPSVHKDGYRYQIIGTKEPAIIDGFENHINEVLAKYGISYLDSVSSNNNKAQIPIEELFQEDFTVLEGHNRHEALLRVMESLIVRNIRILTLEEIEEFAEKWNYKHCSPPLDNREFEKQWKSATKFIAENDDKNNENDNDDKKDKNGKRNGGNSSNKNKNHKDSELDRKKILKTLYYLIVGQFRFKAMIDNGEILYYDDETEHRYKFGAENKIKVELEKLWPIAFGMATKDLEFADELDYELMPLTEGEREEIVKRIRYRFPVYRTEFDADNNIINVKNGLLNIATRTLKPHSADYLTTKQFPVVYNPKAQPKRLVQFLGEVQDVRGVLNIAKMLGYVLMCSSKYEKAFMFLGKGDNGKSVLIKIIEAFVGGENRSSVRLHDISNDKFMLAEFYGKIINAYADISGQDIEDAGTFKALVSGDTIKAQKKHKDPFDFRNKAKLIYSANKLPRSQDDDMFAYAKRWVILQFKSFFKGVNKDRNLIDKLTTEEELSGLLNIALAGFMMLEREGGFEDISIEEIRKQYERDDESVLTFLGKECYIDMSKKALANIFMPETEFYKAYREYYFERFSRADNDIPLDNIPFEMELSKYGIFRRRKQIERKKVFCYMGVITRLEAAQQNLQILEAQRQKTLDS